MGQEDFALPDLLFILVQVHPVPGFLHIPHCLILIVSQHGPMKFPFLLQLTF